MAEIPDSRQYEKNQSRPSNPYNSTPAQSRSADSPSHQRPSQNTNIFVWVAVGILIVVLLAIVF